MNHTVNYSAESLLLQKCLSYISQLLSSWIRSIDSLELQAIYTASSKPSGKNQAFAMLMSKHSNYQEYRWHRADSYTHAENEC